MPQHSALVRAAPRRVFTLVLGLALLSSQSACARAAPEASAVPAAAPSDPAAQTGSDAKAIPRKRIIETTLALDAPEPHRARQQLEQKVAELGGFVETLSVDQSGAEA